MADRLKFSIITPSFNQGAYIEKTILSVVEQDYPNIEYIVIDGGSCDDTVEILKKYSDKIAYCVSEQDKGQAHALNKGFRQATGDIIAWINSDDYYQEGAFTKIARVFEESGASIVNGNCAMIFANGIDNYIDKSGAITYDRLLRYWRKNFCPPQPAIFFRKSIIDKIGLLDEKLEYAMDLELWLRMASRYKFKYFDQLIANYLVHPNSKSGSGSGFKKFKSEWRTVCFNYLNEATAKQKFKFYLEYQLVKILGKT